MGLDVSEGRRARDPGLGAAPPAVKTPDSLAPPVVDPGPGDEAPPKPTHRSGITSDRRFLR